MRDTKIGKILASKLSADASSGDDRRDWPRLLCALEAKLVTDGYRTGAIVRITDISLAGCYVEMLSPPPRGTPAKLSIRLGDATIEVFGKVRSSQDGFGMGVGFTNMGAADFQTLQKFVPTDAKDIADQFKKLTGSLPVNGLPESKTSAESRETQRPPVAVPVERPQQSDLLEAVIGVLCAKTLLTREEIAAELEKIRTAQVPG